MAAKLTPAQEQRVEEIRSFQRTVEHVKRLVAELDHSRAGRTPVIERLCTSIARELAQLRQRALTTSIGTLADTAGALSVLAARGAGISLKIRGLTEGVQSLTLQLDQALKQATAPELRPPAEPPRP